ncbi:MAG: surface glycoprotein, partial [Halobacterium sp.]
MTRTTDKLRAVFLTALMVGSVFAAGIALTGSA